VAPSILASDFSRLGDEIRDVAAAGADVLHVDVMDGHFVPNLTLGPPVVAAVRAVTDLPFDVHLMLTNPENFFTPFADAGADNITIHVEIEADVRDVLRRIRGLGCSAGLSVRPATPAARLQPFLQDIDLILIMTVEPGFGGQSFMADMMPKVEKIRGYIEAKKPGCELEVDGGVNAETAKQCVAAGADVLVAGSAFFKAPDKRAFVRALKG